MLLLLPLEVEEEGQWQVEMELDFAGESDAVLVTATVDTATGICLLLFVVSLWRFSLVTGYRTIPEPCTCFLERTFAAIRYLVGDNDPT